jgi:GR25 family glycosyltransferase involved in LPS biosynthesis
MSKNPIGKIINETFGKAYIKNLKNSHERRNFIINNFDQIGLEYEIFEAYDGMKFVDEDYLIQHGNIQLGYPVSAGFWGNQTTTEHVYMKEINNDTDSFMIFDDDSYFYNFDKSIETFTTMKTNLPEDWDIIILGSIEAIAEDGDFKYKKVTDHTECAGCHGTAVNKRAYKRILEIAQKREFWGDGIINRFRELGGNIYYIHPHIIAQNRVLFSDVNKIYHR